MLGRSAKNMKLLLISIFITLTTATNSYADMSNGVQDDPRPSRFVRKIYAAGKKVEPMNTPYAVIAWASTKTGYQIWGDTRIMDKATFDKVIHILIGKNPADIYIIGNNWGAGSELNKNLQNITKLKEVDVYQGSSFAFTKVNFYPESKERKKIIAEAIDQVIKMQNPKDSF